MRGSVRSTSDVALPAETTDSKRYVAAGLALGLLALIVYSNSFGAGLVFDARAIIAGDFRIQSWDPATIKLIFTHEYWWPETTSDLYRPLTTLSYWANYTLLGGGTRVLGYHIVNFLLHWANVVLVLVVVDRLSKRFVLALVAAALFAVHPVNTEAVTNVVGRADLLATLSVLFGGWCYLRACDERAAHGAGWLVAMGASALTGVFMKETAVVIGAFVVTYDALWRVPRLPGKTLRERLTSGWRNLAPAYVALAPAALAFIVTRIVIHRHTALVSEQFVDNPIAGAAWFPGFMTAWKVIGRCVALLMFPRVLSCDYSYSQIPLYFESDDPWQNAQAWVGVLLVAALVWVAWRSRKSNTAVAWGIWFFLLALLPTSNLIVPIGSIMAERFLYLPSIGFCVVAAYALLALGARLARATKAAPTMQPRVALAGAVLVTSAMGARAFVRNADWHDPISLWKSAVAAAPMSFRTHKGYASALLLSNQDEATIDLAIAGSERALAILDDPPLPIERRDVSMFVDLGVYYRLKAQRLKQRGQAPDAAAFLRKSLSMLGRAQETDQWFRATSRDARLARGWNPADITDVGSAPVYHELGDTYLEMGDFQAAQAAARYAQRLLPDAPRGYVLDGVAAFYQRRPDAAAVAFATALLLDPARSDVWDNLVSCFGAMNYPAPVVQRDGRKAFDTTSEPGRQLVAAAAGGLVQSFDAAKRSDSARRWQARLMRDYGVPATAFSAPR